MKKLKQLRKNLMKRGETQFRLKFKCNGCKGVFKKSWDLYGVMLIDMEHYPRLAGGHVYVLCDNCLLKIKDQRHGI